MGADTFAPFSHYPSKETEYYGQGRAAFVAAFAGLSSANNDGVVDTASWERARVISRGTGFNMLVDGGSNWRGRLFGCPRIAQQQSIKILLHWLVFLLFLPLG